MTRQSIIYKTPVRAGTVSPFAVKLPRAARPLCLQLQNDIPMMWWMCSKEEPVEERKLLVLGTGWEFESQMVGAYLGTWQQEGYVWHLFESAA